jgi:hypothetical protein
MTGRMLKMWYLVCRGERLIVSGVKIFGGYARNRVQEDLLEKRAGYEERFLVRKFQGERKNEKRRMDEEMKRMRKEMESMVEKRKEVRVASERATETQEQSASM